MESLLSASQVGSTRPVPPDQHTKGLNKCNNSLSTHKKQRSLFFRNVTVCQWAMVPNVLKQRSCPEMSQTNYPVIKHHISEGQKHQTHPSKSQKITYEYINTSRL